MTSDHRDRQPLGADTVPKPSWDPSAGKRNWRPVAMFLPLNSRFRILSAVEHAGGAAVAIALAHFWTALFVADGLGPKATLIGSNQQLLVGVQVICGLLALYLAVRVRRRPSRPVAWLLMAWALVEAVPWIPLAIYGHGIFGRIGGTYAVFIIYCGVQGVRGANALKRLDTYPEPPDGPLQLGA